MESRNGHYLESMPPIFDLEEIQAKIGKRVKKRGFQKKGANVKASKCGIFKCYLGC